MTWGFGTRYLGGNLQMLGPHQADHECQPQPWPKNHVQKELMRGLFPQVSVSQLGKLGCLGRGGGEKLVFIVSRSRQGWVFKSCPGSSRAHGQPLKPPCPAQRDYFVVFKMGIDSPS